MEVDRITLLIIFRFLFLLSLVEKGWCIKKLNKKSFEMFKSVKNKY